MRSGFLVFAALAAVFTGCSRTPGRSELPAVWAGPLPDMALVYQRADGIYMRESAGGEHLLAAQGAYPRFSPDGTTVAFVRDKALWTVPAAGGSARRIANAKQPRAVCWHPDGNSIFFTDGESVRRAFPDDGHVAVICSGTRILELDVARGGTLMIGTVKELGGYRLELFDLPSGGGRKLASGCSASLSPDGSRATANQGGHESLIILDVRTGETLDRLAAPEGVTLDNQFWSNHPDWISGISEGAARDVYLYDLPGKRTLRLTGTGDCDRPDVFVR